ncbi:DUF2752 domain-containing protein [Neolewinella aurantiaca]|nr:DUF2752 domain-containing protein [Neolewinella aurantiaca]
MKTLFIYLKLAALVVIPVLLLVLPATYFDSGQPKCVSVLLLGQECYGCGMTRGLMHLIHFDLAEAIYYHPLSVVVFPLLAFLWARWFWRGMQQLKQTGTAG